MPISHFIPKFLIVSHHMTPMQVGVALSLLTGVFGAIGTYCPGVFADRLGKRDVELVHVRADHRDVHRVAVRAGVSICAPSTAVALCRGDRARR